MPVLRKCVISFTVLLSACGGGGGAGIAPAPNPMPSISWVSPTVATPYFYYRPELESAVDW